MLVLHTHAYTQSAHTYTQNVYSVRLFEARIRKSVQAKEIVMHQEKNARNLYVVHGQDGFSVCETVSVREREREREREYGKQYLWIATDRRWTMIECRKWRGSTRNSP